MTSSYVKRSGTQLVDQHNQPFRLRGVGIGGWLLLEGYMLQSYQAIDRPRRFLDHLIQTVGQEFSTYFFEKWYRVFFTGNDIKQIKQEGFNSIRIPLDYQFLYDASDTTVELKRHDNHFEILDQIIALCRHHEVYVILDMHAAPGGQTGTNIDNSENNHPDLFVNQLYVDQLCYIWKDIATRYLEETYIAAFDLLNEPLPEWFSQYNNQLIPLYQKVISAIRSVNPHHMITLEGLHWSTDWSCFTERLDDNLLLQFHKYWNNPDQESIQEYLDLRDRLDVPILMGEGGENNLEWYYSVFKLYDQLDISFNFWTYKKMENQNSIVSFRKPPKWDEFLAAKLSQKESIQVVQQLLQNVTFDDSTINFSCINHILQKDQLVIPAFGYDYYGKEISFHSNNTRNSVLRKQDQLLFVDQYNKEIQPNFKQYNGESYTLENRIFLHLDTGEWVRYTFYYQTTHVPKISVISSHSDQTIIVLSTHPYTDQYNRYTVQITAIHPIQLESIHIK